MLALRQVGIVDLRRDSAAGIGFVRQRQVLQLRQVRHSEGEQRLLVGQQVVRVGQLQAAKYDLRRNIHAQLFGHQVRVIVRVVAESKLVALDSAFQLQVPGDSGDRPVRGADLRHVIERQLIDVPGEPHRLDTDGHVFALHDDAVSVLHHHRQLVVSGVLVLGNAGQPLAAPIVVVGYSIGLVQIARQRQCGVGSAVIGAGVRRDGDLPLLDGEDGHLHRALLEDFVQRPLDLLQIRAVRYLFAAVPFASLGFAVRDGQVVPGIQHVRRVAVPVVHDAIEHFIIADVGKGRGDRGFLAVFADAVVDGLSGSDAAPDRHAVGLAVPVALIAFQCHLAQFEQGDPRAAGLGHVVRLRHREVHQVLAGFGEHRRIRLRRAVHGVAYARAFGHAGQGQAVFAAVRIAVDIVRGDGGQRQRLDRNAGRDVLVAVAVHPDDQIVVPGVRPGGQLGGRAHRPERRAAIRGTGHLVADPIHARQLDSVGLLVVIAAPALGHGGEGLDGQPGAAGEGMDIGAVRRVHLVRAEEHLVLPGRGQRMLGIQRDFVSGFILCPVADVLGGAEIAVPFQSAERYRMERAVFLCRGIGGNHRHAPGQGEIHGNNQVVKPPVAVDIDQDVPGFPVCGIAEGYIHASVVVDDHILEILNPLPVRLRARISDPGDPDPIVDHRLLSRLGIPPVVGFGGDHQPGDGQAVRLAVLLECHGFAGHALQIDALDAPHGHGGRALGVAELPAVAKRVAHEVRKRVSSKAIRSERLFIRRVPRQAKRRVEGQILQKLRTIPHLIGGVALGRAHDPRNSGSGRTFDDHCIRREDVGSFPPFRFARFTSHVEGIVAIQRADIQIVPLAVKVGIQVLKRLHIERVFLIRAQGHAVHQVEQHVSIRAVAGVQGAEEVETHAVQAVDIDLQVLRPGLGGDVGAAGDGPDLRGRRRAALQRLVGYEVHQNRPIQPLQAHLFVGAGRGKRIDAVEPGPGDGSVDHAGQDRDPVVRPLVLPVSALQVRVPAQIAGDDIPVAIDALVGGAAPLHRGRMVRRNRSIGRHDVVQFTELG